MDDERIKQLNKQINKNKKKIRNIEIKECVISFGPGVVLLGSITGYIYTHPENTFLQYAYSYFLLLSIGTSIAFSLYIDNDKNMKKREEIKNNTKECLNELHGIALEEDKKIMKLRRQMCYNTTNDREV